MNKLKNKTELITAILENTTAYHSGGIIIDRRDDHIRCYNKHEKSFEAIHVLNSLGAFRVKIEVDEKRHVYLKIW